MNKIIKVDRVCCVLEARELEELGANAICVSLAKNARFNDERVIGLETAVEIKRSIKKVKYIGEVDFNCNVSELIETAKLVGFDALQPNTHNIPSIQHIKSLKAEKINISYSYIEATHDDHPAWIMKHFENIEELNAIYFQLDVLSEYPDSWDFLKFSSPEYPEEVQISDINALARTWSLLVSLDYSPTNIKEIFATLTDIQGVSMVLADSSPREDIHYFDFASVKEILKTLNLDLPRYLNYGLNRYSSNEI